MLPRCAVKWRELKWINLPGIKASEEPNLEEEGGGGRKAVVLADSRAEQEAFRGHPVGKASGQPGAIPEPGNLFSGVWLWCVSLQGAAPRRLYGASSMSFGSL